MPSLSTFASVILLLVVVITNHATAFMHIHNSPSSSIHGCTQTLTTVSFASNGANEDYTATEVNEMDTLILSLSLEPTDDSRRQRLAHVFETELAKDDCRRFANLFDQVLATVGDRIQLQAKKKVLEAQQEEHQLDEEISQDSDSNDEEKGDGDFMGMSKSPEERQLWALVDMMVQSKTLSKKAFGQLGNKGTMQ